MAEKDNKEDIQVNIEPDIITKECNRCNLVKSVTEFAKGRNQCKECRRAGQRCIHDKYKFYCRECSTNGYCVHGKDKRLCREGCSGSIICEHDVKKYSCKICNCELDCEHQIKLVDCDICKNILICQHNKLKSKCKICNLKPKKCVHNIKRTNCKICHTSILCIHGKEKRKCRDGCGGQAFCIHNKDKKRCKDCGGCMVCIHKKEKAQCIICNPKIACELCKSIIVTKYTRFYPLCQACFSFTNPDSKLSTVFKIKEKYMVDELKTRLKDIPIRLYIDKVVDGGCSKKRPDILIDCLTHSIVIECDENQHKNYECENRRTVELFSDLGNRPLVLVRFNPDKYRKLSGDINNGCFKPIIKIEDSHEKKFYNLVEDEWIRRIELLIPIIKQYIDLATFPQKEITVIQLFYDNFD